MIEENPVALATTINHKPHVIAVAFCKVINKDSVLITDNFMKTCKNNILKNGNVALAVWDKSWSGFQLKGKASYYKKGKWFDQMKQLKENKDCPAKGAILVKVNQIIKLA